MISDQKVYKRNIEKPCKYIRQISSFNIILEIDLICKCNIYLCKYLPCFHRSKHVAANFFFFWNIVSRFMSYGKKWGEYNGWSRNIARNFVIIVHSSNNCGIVETSLNIQTRTYNCFTCVINRKLINKNRIKFAAHNNSTVSILRRKCLVKKSKF